MRRAVFLFSFCFLNARLQIELFVRPFNKTGQCRFAKNALELMLAKNESVCRYSETSMCVARRGARARARAFFHARTRSAIRDVDTDDVDFTTLLTALPERVTSVQLRGTGFKCQLDAFLRAMPRNLEVRRRRLASGERHTHTQSCSSLQVLDLAYNR